ncbi:hypothetical protein HAX54_022046, partial [Datura stramonium]|nr:hypothetical protein [Datura stramonium]
KLKGHLKEHCWKLVGYPSHFKKKKSNCTGGGGSTAYNAMVEDLTLQNHHKGHHSSNLPTASHVTTNLTELYQGMEHGRTSQAENRRISQAANVTLPGTCVH